MRKPALMARIQAGMLQFRTLNLRTKQLAIAAIVFIFPLLLIACGGGTTGHNAVAPTWSYTALGDSLADGVLAQQGYVQRYATYVNSDTGANVNNDQPWRSGLAQRRLIECDRE